MMKIHHVGYLVKKMDRAIDSFTILGFCSISDMIYDEYRDVDIQFMEKDGYVVELVSPRSDRSVVSNLIKTYKNTPYHICYESDSFEDDLKTLELSHFTMFDEPCPAPALGDRRVCFLQSPRIGMIELVEMEREDNM